MMLSDLPEQDRFKLLAVGIFMGADGGRARPGNAGLGEFGPHADTWKKLLQRTVKAGWLLLEQRGGARRGPGGTTVRKASVYAASVPYEVWVAREEILAGAPYRSASAGDANPMKEVSGRPLQAPSKGVPDAPFEGEGTPTPGFEGGTVTPPSGDLAGGTVTPPSSSAGGFEGGTQRFEGGVATPPHHVVTSRTSTTAPSSSSAEAPRKEEGGGGDAAHQEQQRQDVIAFLRALPAPWSVGKVTAQALTPLLLEALADTGWHLDGDLVAELTGNAQGVRNPRAMLRRRIEDLPRRNLPAAAEPRRPAIPEWCGQCAGGDPAAKSDPAMRWIDTPSGGTKPCPECSLQAHRAPQPERTPA